MPTWQSYLDENKDRFLDELLDFLRIPSISALPERAGDVARAGEWVAARLRAAGMEGVRVLPTGGHPVVYGGWLHAPGKLWTRPTLEINGIWGGFQGDGVKTVLPNAAHAKITCRLVPNQDPLAIPKLIAAHVERHAPPGVRVATTRLGFAAYPYLMPADHAGNQAARAVLEEIYGRSPYIVRTGGSIPVCTVLLRNLGVYTVNFGFGLEDEHIHAPDEFFRLSSFARGQIAYCKLLHRLGESTGGVL